MRGAASPILVMRRRWRGGVVFMRSAALNVMAPANGSSPGSVTAADVEEMKSRPAKVVRDYLTPMPSRLLAMTLSDLLGETEQSCSSSASSPSSSLEAASAPDVLPQGHHLVYFPLQTPASRLAVDGADADHAPRSPGFTRRLWAGGEVVFGRRGGAAAAGLVLDGRAWMCREEIEDVRVKGRAGGLDEKVLVDVRRRYGLGHGESEDDAGGRAWDIEERRTLVFMRSPGGSPSSAAATVPPPRLIKYPHPPTSSASLVPTPPHLFHFSALTYNAHAIHIDPLYARAHDNHRALLVHGPLSLALMLRVLANHIRGGGGGAAAGGEVVSIVYRNYAPLYVGERMTVCVRRAGGAGQEGGQAWDVWVEGPEGGLAVKGTAMVVDGHGMEEAASMEPAGTLRMLS